LETHTIEITDLAHGGDGVGRIDGKVCFVAGALPGDTAEVEITATAKQFFRARISSLVKASAHRRETVCGSFPECGGCAWLHFEYPGQAEWKCRIVEESLRRIAGLDVTPDWLEAPDLRFGYRTRAEFHGDGKKFGFYARNSHEIIDIESCPLCHEKLNDAFAVLRELRLKGSVQVTVNPESDEVLAWTPAPFRRLKDRFPLAGSPKDRKGPAGFVFNGVPVVNGAFSQASLLLNEMLIEETHRMIGNAVSILDLYCGSGNLSITLPGHIAVAGMDHHKDAVRIAKKVSGRDYRQGNEKAMKTLLREMDPDTVLLDPPRSGAKQLVPALARCTARAIVYVSCDPATLARDLKILASGGWRVAEISALDMFPHTPHVECVCRLEK
jgi:23S rRNA (uracil1939-C5)-methyltransferase